jgi:hypothetical protein
MVNGASLSVACGIINKEGGECMLMKSYEILPDNKIAGISSLHFLS